jgi:hypothetical protein
MIIKFGPKNRHITIPDDYDVIKEGEVKVGDLFLNLSNYHFNMVDSEDLLMDAGNFDLLIRKRN